jgi:AcrR family transcriptional regulator
MSRAAKPSQDPSTRPRRVYGGISADQRVAARRERLLEAALDEFGTRGFLATGVKDVCRRAGLTDRYFYESFRDRNELFVAVFDGATARLFEVVATAVLAAPATAEGQVRAAIESYVHALADDPRIARIVFVEAASAGPEVERHMRVTLRRFADLVATTARGLLPASVTDEFLRFASLACVGAIERLMIEWQDGELGLSIDQLNDYLVATLLGGFAVTRRQGRTT